MATRYYLDNGSGFAEVVGRIRVTGSEDGGGLAGLVRSANGSDFGSGGVIIDDPAGELDILGWRPFYVEEDDATPSRIWTGFVNGRRVSQMNFDGIGRIWDCDLGDLNLILGLRVFRNRKRPAELDYERIAYMLANWPNPEWPVYDNGEVQTGSAAEFDETDLDAKYADEVLSEMTLEQSMFFVYWDHDALPGEEISLMFGPVSVARGTLTVSLSNDPDDIDDETCFVAEVGQLLNREPGFTYSGVYVIHNGGKYYTQNEATADTYIRRDKVLRTDRIGLQSTAISVANRFLNNADVERDTLTCTVRVRNDQVQLIQEGYRIPVKFTHIPGYGDDGAFHSITIHQITLRRPENGNEDGWLLDLVMSNQAPAGISMGGDPGEFPLPPASSPSLIQHVTNFGSLTWPAGAPTDGDLLLLWVTERTASQFPGTLAGWTSIATAEETSVFGDQNGGRLMWKIASGEGASIALDDPLNHVGCAMEWSPSTIGNHVAQSNLNNATMTSGGAITPSAANAIVVGAAVVGSFGINPTTPDSGVTELADMAQFGGSAANTWVGYKTVASPTSTIVGGTIVSGAGPTRNEYGGVTVALLGSAEANPPAPGQEVPWTVVDMAEAGGVSVGTTAFPYAAGSLRVKVDNVVITQASYTETDPTCGDFALSWLIDDDEVVTVSYQGI